MFPDKFQYLCEWFIRYKILEGKKIPNFYMKNYMEIDRDQVVRIVEMTHQYWIEELKQKGFKFPQTN